MCTPLLKNQKITDFEESCEDLKKRPLFTTGDDFYRVDCSMCTVGFHCCSPHGISVLLLQSAHYWFPIVAVRMLLVFYCCFPHGISVLLMHSAQYWGADCNDRTLIIT